MQKLPYAWSGDPELKAMMITEALLAEKRGNYHQSSYRASARGEEFKGCSVGCALKALGHQNAADNGYLSVRIYGGHRQISFLQEWVFDHLPIPRAYSWTPEFFQAIPVGADLRPVVLKFMLWALEDDFFGLAPNRTESEIGLETVRRRYLEALSGVEPAKLEWAEAGEIARKRSCEVDHPKEVERLRIYQLAAFAGHVGKGKEIRTFLEDLWRKNHRPTEMAEYVSSWLLRELQTAPIHPDAPQAAERLKEPEETPTAPQLPLEAVTGSTEPQRV